MAIAYNLKISNWSPQDSFQDFIKTLNECGPLAVSGCFGIPHYKGSPKTVEGKNGYINGHPIYYFNKDDFLGTHLTMVHKIVLIGARTIKGQNYVYFLDSLDPSKPSSPSERRIFIMTYKKLTLENRIVDLYGVKRMNAPREIGYAHYSSNGKSMQKLS